MAKNKSKKPFYKRWWFILLVIIVVFVAIPGEDSEDVAEPNSEPTESSAPAESTKEPTESSEEPTKTREDMTLDEFLEDAVIEVMGEETNTEKPTFIKIENETESMKQVYVNGNDNLTTNMIKTGMLSDAAKFYEIISQDSEAMELEDIELNYMMTLVDKYGEEGEYVVMVIGMSTETLSRINWDNFIYTNIPDVAYQYSTHPAIE